MKISSKLIISFILVLGLITIGVYQVFAHSNLDKNILDVKSEITVSLQEMVTPNIAPSNEQVDEYIKKNSITPIDTKRFDRYVLILSEGMVDNLSTDKGGRLYYKSQSISGYGIVSCTSGGIGSSHIIVRFNDNEILKKASTLKVLCNDNTVIEVKSNNKPGQIISYPGTIENMSVLKKVYVFDSDKNIIFESK
jgi:hypothetical protein